MEIRSGAEITSNQAQTITGFTQQQLKSSEQIFSDVAEITQRVKFLVGASESVALMAGTLTERTNELERHLAPENSGGTVKHGH
jgi:methyl-accepting chemotaxis protein